MMEIDNEHPNVLNYAGRRPRRGLRLMLIAVAFVATGYELHRYKPAIENRCKMLYWQSRCLSFSTVATRSYQTAEGEKVVAAFTPFLRPQLLWTDCQTDVCAFCGRVSNRNGDRLVIIHYREYFLEYESIEADVTEPGSLFKEPRLIDQGHRVDDRANINPTKPDRPFRATVGAGHRNKSNPSHFEIPFQAFGQAGLLDCWLDDSDHVHLVDMSKDGLWARYQDELAWCCLQNSM